MVGCKGREIEAVVWLYIVVSQNCVWLSRVYQENMWGLAARCGKCMTTAVSGFEIYFFLAVSGKTANSCSCTDLVSSK